MSLCCGDIGHLASAPCRCAAGQVARLHRINRDDDGNAESVMAQDSRALRVAGALNECRTWMGYLEGRLRSGDVAMARSYAVDVEEAAKRVLALLHDYLDKPRNEASNGPWSAAEKRGG